MKIGYIYKLFLFSLDVVFLTLLFTLETKHVVLNGGNKNIILQKGAKTLYIDKLGVGAHIDLLAMTVMKNI